MFTLEQQTLTYYKTTMKNKSQDWEKELENIIITKHSGLGLCETMFVNTIVPFIEQLLQKERERAIRDMESLLVKRQQKASWFDGDMQVIGRGFLYNVIDILLDKDEKQEHSN